MQYRIFPFWWAQYAAAQVFTGSKPGKPLAELAAAVRPTRILFVASNWAVERSAAPIYALAAGKRGDLGEVDAGHTQGLKAHPMEYAQRVVGFFEQHLR